MRVLNFSVDNSTPTAIVINDKSVNSVVIQCRTAVDMRLMEEAGASDYFTIKSGTVFSLPMRLVEYGPFYLLSGSGTVTAEILLILE